MSVRIYLSFANIFSKCPLNKENLNKGATDSLVQLSKPSAKKNPPTTLAPLSDKNSGQSPNDPKPPSTLVPLSDQIGGQPSNKTSSILKRSRPTTLPIQELLCLPIGVGFSETDISATGPPRSKHLGSLIRTPRPRGP